MASAYRGTSSKSRCSDPVLAVLDQELCPEGIDRGGVPAQRRGVQLDRAEEGRRRPRARRPRVRPAPAEAGGRRRLRAARRRRSTEAGRRRSLDLRVDEHPRVDRGARAHRPSTSWPRDLEGARGCRRHRGRRGPARGRCYAPARARCRRRTRSSAASPSGGGVKSSARHVGLIPERGRVGLALAARNGGRGEGSGGREGLGHGAVHCVGHGGGPDAVQTVDRLDRARGVNLACEGGHDDRQERADEREAYRQLDGGQPACRSRAATAARGRSSHSDLSV